MGLFSDLIDLADTVVRAGNVVYEKAQKIQQFTEELETMSDFELYCYHMACKKKKKKRGMDTNSLFFK